MFEFAVFWLGLLHGDQRPPGLALFLFGVECEFLQLVKGADSMSAEHMLARSLARSRSQSPSAWKLSALPYYVKSKREGGEVRCACGHVQVQCVCNKDTGGLQGPHGAHNFVYQTPYRTVKLTNTIFFLFS